MDSASTPAGHLEPGADGEAVLHPEELAVSAEVHGREPVRCWSCGRWIAPGHEATLSVSRHGEIAVAELAHRACAPPRAELAALVALALADPRGIAFAQALHPEAGAVLVWQRKLDIRLRGPASGELRPYLDGHRRSGFHPMRRDEPVGLLHRWRLATARDDLVLAREGEEVDRFAGAVADAPARWLDTLRASGYCLVIAGVDLGLERGAVDQLQRALRVGYAVMGLVEFAPG